LLEQRHRAVGGVELAGEQLLAQLPKECYGLD
jgi:hypothetical protein